MKKQIQTDAEEKVKQMDSYVMLNFESYDAKAQFMEKFGCDPQDKFIQGEYLNKLIDEMF